MGGEASKPSRRAFAPGGTLGVLAAITSLCVAILLSCSTERTPTPAKVSSAPARARPAAAAGPASVVRELGAEVVPFGPAGRGLAVHTAFHRTEARPEATAVSFTGRPTLTLATVGLEGGAPRVAGARAMRVGAHLTELLEATRHTVEQSFRFEQRPAGDVVVTIAATGLPYRETTTAGLHFGARGEGVVYGHGTWIDGAGRRTAVPSEWTGSHIALRVPRAVVAESVYPAVLDPTLSAELPVAPLVDEPTDAVAVGLASGPSTYLVAYVRGGGKGELLATRVRKSDRAVLDPEGIELAPSSGELQVTWDGAQYVVAAYLADGFLLNRIDEASNVPLDGAGVVLRRGLSAVATGGGRAAVASYEPGNGYELVARALQVPSTLLGSTLLGADERSGSFPRPAPLIVGSKLVTLWVERGVDDVHARLRSRVVDLLTEQAVGSAPVDLSSRLNAGLWYYGASPYPRVLAATDGVRIAVYHPVHSAPHELWRIAPATGAADGPPIPLPCSALSARLAVSGNHALLQCDVDTVLRIDLATGTVLDVTPRQVPFPLRELAADGDGFLIAGPNVVARMRSSDGAITSPYFALPRGPAPQTTPQIAAGAGVYLAAWEDRRRGPAVPTAIHAARFDADGNSLDATSHELATVGTRPRVAFDGDRFVVAYRDGPAGRILTVDPKSGDAQGVAVDMGELLAEHLVGQRGTALVASSQRGRRFDGATRTFLGPEQSLIPFYVNALAVTAHDDDFLVTFFASSAPFVRRLNRLTGKLGTLDALPIAPGFRTVTAATVVGDAMLVFNADTEATLVDAKTLAKRNAVSFALPNTDEPLIGLVMADGVSTYLPTTTRYGSGAPVRLLRFGGATSGLVGPAAGVEVIGPASSQTSVGRPASIAPGQIAVPFSRYEGAPLHVTRSYVRFLAHGVLGSACTEYAECGSLRCIDGVCCDSACGDGDPSDCLACSVAAGGAKDGACGTRLACVDAATGDGSATDAGTDVWPASPEGDGGISVAADGSTVAGDDAGQSSEVGALAPVGAGGGCAAAPGRARLGTPAWLLLAAVLTLRRLDRRRAALVCSMAVLALFAACVRDEGPRAGSPPPRSSVATAPARWSNPIDLTAWTERRWAFAAAGATLSASGRAHTITLRGDRLAYRSKLGELTLETVEPALGAIAHRPDGTATREHGDVRETTHNDAAGVVRTWRLARAPAGEFVVRLRPQGSPLRTIDAIGALFGAPGAGLRLSHGAWVGADGRETRVPLERDAGDLVLRVPRAVLERTSYPAVLDPRLEDAVDVESTPTEGGGDVSSLTELGQGLTTTLALFEREVITAGVRALYAARVRRSDGVRLETARAVAVTPFVNWHETIASTTFDGESYVVAYGAESPFELVRVREADGAVTKRRTLSGPYYRGALTVRWDGTRHLLYFPFAGKVMVLNRDLEDVVTVAAPASSNAVGASFVVLGNVALFAWVDATRQGFLQRYATTALTPLDATPIPVGPGTYSLGHAAHDGARFLLHRSADDGTFEGIFVDPTTGITGRTTLPGGYVWGLSGAAGTFLVSVQEQQQQLAYRIDGATRSVLTGAPLSLSNTKFIGVASGPSKHAVLTTAELVHVDALSGAVTTTDAARRAMDQGRARVGAGGGGALVVWSDSPGAAAMPLDQAARPLLASATRLTEETTWSVGTPVFDGAAFVVSFETSKGKYVRRVSPTGQLLDAAPTKTALTGNVVGAAGAGGVTLLVGTGASQRFADGVPLDAVPLGVPALGDQNVVVPVGADFIVLSSYSCELLGTRVAAGSGAATGLVPMGSGPCQPWPAAAQHVGGLVHLARIDDGARLAAFRPSDLALTHEVGEPGKFAAASIDGTSALFLQALDGERQWRPLRRRLSDRSRVEPTALDAGLDAGLVEEGFSIPTTGSVAPLGEGRFVVVNTMWSPELGAFRTYVRVLTYAPDGVACGGDDDCASTYCDAGACWRAPDAGPADGGLPDSGTADAALVDAAVDGEADAAVADGGPADTSLPPGPTAGEDAGAPLPGVDASTAPPPAATDAPAAPASSSGCSVQATRAPPMLALAPWLLILVAARRRRGAAVAHAAKPRTARGLRVDA